MSAIQDAARRLADALPGLAYYGRVGDGPNLLRARDELAAELVAFGETCAGRVEPAASRCSTCGHEPTALPTTFADHLPACAGCGTRAYAAMGGQVPPPVDIQLTAAELGAAIRDMKSFGGPIDPAAVAALAKLRAARGTR